MENDATTQLTPELYNKLFEKHEAITARHAALQARQAALVAAIQKTLDALETVYMGLPVNQFPGPPQSIVDQLKAALAAAQVE